MMSVVLFVLSVLLVAAGDGWGACVQSSNYIMSSWGTCQSGGGKLYSTTSSAFCVGSSVGCTWHVTTGVSCGKLEDSYTFLNEGVSTENNCKYAVGGDCYSYNGNYFYYRYTLCDNKAEADSVNCVNDPTGPTCKPTYHCQNSGGAVPGGVGGSPPRALIFRCVAGVCTQTATLNGTCQDWGYCGEGESDCNVQDTSGHPPCRRSGAEYISGRSCYYQCADGSSMRCNPVSTDYIAGSQWAGRCPGSPPSSCYRSSSSGAPGSSGSGASSPAPGSSDSGGSSAAPGSSGSGDDSGEYMQVLEAIKDTLHSANLQRDNVNSLLGDIADNSFNNWRINYVTSQGVDGINNRLSTLQERILPIAEASRASADSSTSLLTAINEYLRDDSVWRHPDTSYNPLLRDIKNAVESLDSPASSGSSAGSSASLLSRDSAFARWWSDYNQDSAAQKGVLGKLWDSIKPKRDSVRVADCDGFNGCIAVYKRIDYCKNAWGVGFEECTQGGSPFDGMINVESSILSTLWDAIWGEDSTELSSVAPLDTAPLSRTPAEDSARNAIKNANDSIDLPSIGRTLDSMRVRLDSVKTKKDSVKIDVDSTMMDSSEAARYVQHILLPSGTGTACFVCHADLGTFGGLAPDGLSIHIDFSSFGGYNWCDLGRAIVKIMTLVVCISLTLGSWAAAFGYSPKNDA